MGSALLSLGAGQLDTRLVTHHVALHEMADAYDVFSRAKETGPMKVVLTRLYEFERGIARSCC